LRKDSALSGFAGRCRSSDVAAPEDGRTPTEALQPSLAHYAMERAWERRHDWEKIGAQARLTLKTKICEKPAEVFAGMLLLLAEQQRGFGKEKARKK
jgi:hypothetical protein